MAPLVGVAVLVESVVSAVVKVVGLFRKKSAPKLTQKDMDKLAEEIRRYRKRAEEKEKKALGL